MPMILSKTIVATLELAEFELDEVFCVKMLSLTI